MSYTRISRILWTTVGKWAVLSSSRGRELDKRHICKCNLCKWTSVFKMMFTIDSKTNYNFPCYGIEAASSSDYSVLSSTALCTPTYTFFDKTGIIDCLNYAVDDRSRAIASRLVQLCDSFDEELLQPGCRTCWMISLLFRWLI
ncbi:unnamed protein product [Strongylus vulgaris]|uniref:Uncharacterized protein n=1 Tax=Strongylus vulgaris TaxID=40348 RepID=A0A3P7JFU7_STRVU|nr:unnamed protein product [Strongylus vulgaris]